MPGEVGRDDPPGERRDDGRDERRPGEQGDGADEIGAVGDAEHREPTDRHHHRSPDALQHPHDGEFWQARAQRTEHRGEREDCDGGEENTTGPEAPGDPSTQRDEHGERQQVGRDRDADRNRWHTERTTDARGGSGEDRAVEIFHKECAGDEKCDVPLPVLPHDSRT